MNALGSAWRLRLATGLLLALVGCRESSAARELPPSAEAVAECGAKGQPDCPTQRWMKSTLQAYLRTRDFKRLQTSLRALAQRAPEGYELWTETAERGAKAAASSDEAGVQKSCQDCHERYRSRFRQQHRTAAPP